MIAPDTFPEEVWLVDPPRIVRTEIRAWKFYKNGERTAFVADGICEIEVPQAALFPARAEALVEFESQRSISRRIP